MGSQTWWEAIIKAWPQIMVTVGLAIIMIVAHQYHAKEKK